MDKNKKFKILCCCAAGNGCCQLVMLKVKRVYEKLGLKITIEANTTSVGKAIAHKYDCVYCNVSLEKQFEEAKKKGAVIIGLKNIMSEQEIEDKTKAYLETL
jgi:ascorbate PTS system EIIB component